MGGVYKRLRACLLAVVIAAPVVSAGCAVRARVYDPYDHDYHRWDSNERHAYREYWEDRHEQYRDYRRLNDDERSEYWAWRHRRLEGHGD